MYICSPFAACPRVGTKRRSYISYAFSGWLPKAALLILVMCMFSACSTAPDFPAYASGDIYQPPTNVGTGDIHALDGNLVW